MINQGDKVWVTLPAEVVRVDSHDNSLPYEVELSDATNVNGEDIQIWVSESEVTVD